MLQQLLHWCPSYFQISYRAAALSGIGILGLAFGLLFAFIGIAIYSAIFSWVANKFDAHTTYESVLKIMWYEQAYNQIMGLFYFLGLLLLSVPFIVILGFNPDSTVLGIAWITIFIFASIAFAIFTFWVCYLYSCCSYVIK